MARFPRRPGGNKGQACRRLHRRRRNSKGQVAKEGGGCTPSEVFARMVVR